MKGNKDKYELWINEDTRSLYIENSNKVFCPFSYQFVDPDWLDKLYEALNRGAYTGDKKIPMECSLFGYITPEGLVYKVEEVENVSNKSE